MRRFIAFILLFVVTSAEPAHAQWHQGFDLESPSISKEALIAILDAHDIAGDDRDHALAAHERLLSDYSEARHRVQIGWRRVGDALQQWREENGLTIHPLETHGLDFGAHEVNEKQLRDHLDAETTFARSVFAIPSIAANPDIRSAIMFPEVQRTLRTIRLWESGMSPRFRDLYVLKEVLAELELSEPSRGLLAPILDRYTEQMFAAARDWQQYRVTSHSRFFHAQIYRNDLGTEMEEVKRAKMRAWRDDDRTHVDRFIAINRQFHSQVLATVQDPADRETLRSAIEAERFPEYHAISPVHDVLDALVTHPTLSDEERASVGDLAGRFGDQWNALRDRLISTAIRAETTEFIARCDDIRLSRRLYASAARPEDHEDPVVIHPCEPLIVEREELVKSTLREVARLLNDDTIKRLDADIRLMLTWAAMGEA